MGCIMDEPKIRLTPTKIHNHSFSIVRKGGYDPDEVDSFLDTVAEDYMIFADMINHAYAEVEEYAKKYREQLMICETARSRSEENPGKPKTTQEDLLFRIEALERIVNQQKAAELKEDGEKKKQKEGVAHAKAPQEREK